MRGITFAMLVVLSASANAHEGHEHEDEPAPKVDASGTGPRLELRSPRVELLAVRAPTTLTIYIDDYASNVPLAGLRVQMRVGTQVLEAAASAAGVYRIPADLLGATDAQPVSFMLHGETLDEQLAGLLPAAPDETGSRPDRRSGPGAATIAVGLLIAFGLMLVWRFRNRKSVQLPAR